MMNVHSILINAVSPALFAFNEFELADFYMVDAPWGAKKGDQVTDQDLISIAFWLSNNYGGFEPSKDKLLDAIKAIAHSNRFHPVRAYISALEWDGVGRLDSWLKTYVNAEAREPYLSQVSRKLLIAMVARAFEPGCQFDQVMILEGVQGCGKSTTARMLGGEWFTDAALNIGDKDAVLAMRGQWVVEIGELSAMNKGEVNAIKAFISQRADRIRAPYGRLTENHPRQCVFIGTTNNSEYLRDTTGNRRFWPVKVGECNTAALKRDRDQLIAEARFHYELVEPLYLTGKAAEQALLEAEGREVHDHWEDKLREFFEGELPEGFSLLKFRVQDLFEFGPLATERSSPYEFQRAKNVLRKLGFREIRVDGYRFWRKDTKESAGEC
jgi:putative DNA primase/helicase